MRPLSFRRGAFGAAMFATALMVSVTNVPALVVAAQAAPLPFGVADSALRQQLWGTIRVTKPYGAAIRTAPSSNADVLITAACNDAFEVLEMRGGWYLVEYPGVARGWIGAGRVSALSGGYPPVVECGRGVTFQVGNIVAPSVARGCLSLRRAPSRQAHIDACVGNDARYVIYNGPFDPGTGEDWYYLVSPYNGGWALADYLIHSELPPGFVS